MPRHSAVFVRLVLVGLVLALLQETHAQSPESNLGFNRDIRPILSSACYRCHGIDAKTREANLRLDTAEGAFAKRDDNSAAIVPGKIDESLVWARINSTDPDEVMPPPASNRQLTDSEKKTLQSWMEQGARYEKHWSFEQIVAPKSDRPIDQFLAEEMGRKGLAASGQADPVTQVRRLAFTLTGLPPALSEVEQFVADPSDASYAKLVDRYLASSHFGEELAKHWLDVARYGDTHGLHLDNERQAWAFRDWVVDAFNANMPYSQFTIEQLAGDLLPNPTPSQLVATGFNRSNVTTSEGGAINDEFLFRYAVDRTSTTVQAWLGLTAGCAVCHDHKYDPISTREFYSMYAFFYSAADPAMDGNINKTKPFLPLPTAEQAQALERAKQNEAQSLSNLQQVASSAESIAMSSVLDPKKTQTGPFTAVWINDDFPVGAVLRNTTRNEPVWTEDPSVPMGRRALRQAFGHKYEQTITGGLSPFWIPEKANLSVWMMPDRLEPPRVAFLEVKSEGTTKRWVWCDNPEDAKLVDSSVERVVGKLPQAGRWTELSIPLTEFKEGKRVKEIKLGLFDGICSWDGLVCTGNQREQDQFTSDVVSWWTSVKGSDVPLASGELAKALKEGPESELGKKKLDEVATFFRTYISDAVPSEVLAARRKWQQSQVDRAAIESQIPGTLIFNDDTKMRPAYIMVRGQYDQKGEPVTPGIPAILPPLSIREDSKQPNRLDLAEWMVSPQNPLTARVAVNRFWQQVFGVGLVKSGDDFGSQGTPPSHPELLDYLANRFRSNGWNVKELLREMVTTAAFRRSAMVHPEGWNIDPENRYLSRGPRLRLDAEQIRDNVLAVSGLLNRKRGGPGIRGYQPSNIWEPVGYGDSNTRYYIQDHGDDLYRRSLYSFIKRTAPPPFMSNFDAPNREMICSRRERSNTPLQALQLMNDVQHVEAARVLAERVCGNQSIKPDDRIAFMFQQVLSRKPTALEQKVIESAFEKFQMRFSENEVDAKRLIAVGERPYSVQVPPKELAAFTLVANLMLNLDETVNRN
ncbi:MAG: PSD1 and planctomycete cytochrome C domain-containing protein [Pirellula sp.]